jgi:GAF domain-containing protein
VSDNAASEILAQGTRAVAHTDPLASSLETLLHVTCDQLDIESAAVVVVDGPSGHLAIVSSFGLGEPAATGLTAALRNPEHPIARTLRDPVATFDVPPSQPGGPALRSHLPIMVTRDGTDTTLGVLALAHDHPTEAEPRRLLEAIADLAALALERSHAA